MIDTPLKAALFFGGTGLLLELVAVLLRVHFVRRVYYLGMLFLTAFGATLLFLYTLTFPAGIVLVIAFFRVINALRVLSRQVREERSFRVTNRSSLMLAVLQIGTILLFAINEYFSISAVHWLYGLLVTALVTSMYLCATIIQNLRRTHIRPYDKYTPDADLPTVSVCIPARNETQDLPEVLASVLANDYPKLEVLVLDDCSQDRTSEIIKGFATQGVRFLQGEKPRAGWLAKNQAYQTLAEAASGELLLFCGVDIRFDQKAIRYLVATMIARHKRMLSVMPSEPNKPHESTLLQPMRYWWELALPRQIFKRPPAVSSLWLIERSALENLNNFKAVSNTVIPEAYLAKQIANDDEYTFMRSNGKLRIHTVKDLGQQLETAIRMRYPQLRKRPENVALLTIAELGLFIVPFGVFILGFFTPLGVLWMLAGTTIICLGYVHYRILQAAGNKHIAWRLLTMPVACIVELAVLIVSMWRYEFGTVEWKERNICIPVMQSIPRLPKA